MGYKLLQAVRTLSSISITSLCTGQQLLHQLTRVIAYQHVARPLMASYVTNPRDEPCADTHSEQ